MTKLQVRVVLIFWAFIIGSLSLAMSSNNAAESRRNQSAWTAEKNETTRQRALQNMTITRVMTVTRTPNQSVTPTLTPTIRVR